MSEDPIVDRYGEPQEELDEGLLLYDPSQDAGDDETPPRRPPRGGTGSRIGWLVMALIIAAGAATYGYRAITPTAESAPSAELPPIFDPMPEATVVSEAIVPVPSADLEGPIGSRLPITVRVSQRAGLPWGDTLVHFRIDVGNGVLIESDVRSSLDGMATTTLALPMRPGQTIVYASVPGTSIDEARIVATAQPGMPERIEIAAGNQQEAEVGQLLPTRLVVRLTDSLGNPIPEASVRFRVDVGDGLTAPSQTRTDETGQASALWRLGSDAGEHRLVASTPYFAEEVVFTAQATPRVGPAPTPEQPIETSPVSVVPDLFAVGGGHACALEAGIVLCRGGNDRGQASVQGPAGLSAITAGASHTCGLGPDGLATCWGANEAGQLGDGTRTDRSTPVRVRTDLRFSVLTAGSSHTCGLAGGGVPLCWGLNLSGQLGDGTRNDQTLPRTVGGGLSFGDLVAGWSHTCGLTSSGNAFCWGLNSQGQLGDGSRLDRLAPTLVRGAVTTLVAGSAHTCGISRGVVLCWGSNTFGQLGTDSQEDSAQPVEVVGLPGAPTHIAAGAVHTCALTGGRAYCWGQNLQGQLGDGTTVNRSTAVPVEGDLTFVDIYAGGALTCGRTDSDAEYCWGLNSQGQLGDGSRVSRSRPTLVAR